jgi:ribonuclease HI
MEMMLNIPPLHLHLQNEAVNTNCRYTISGKEEIKQLVDKNLEELYWTKDDLMTALEYTDSIDLEYNFDKNYVVEFPEREDIENVLVENTETVKNWYTDGSAIPRVGVGSGVFDSANERSFETRLDDHATVFQAEVKAIQECAQINLKEGVTGKTIIFHSDSKAALMAMLSNEIRSKTVKDCVSDLKKISRMNKVKLEWIKAHVGHYGNERADECAKNGTKKTLKRRRQFTVNVPKAAIRTRTKELLNSWSKDFWDRKEGMKHSKEFIRVHDVHRTKELLALSRKQTSVLTEVLTGHGPVRYILAKKGFSDTTTCRFCETSTETMKHLVCECTYLCSKRVEVFGTRFATLLCAKSLRKLSLRHIYKFMEQLKLR